MSRVDNADIGASVVVLAGLWATLISGLSFGVLGLITVSAIVLLILHHRGSLSGFAGKVGATHPGVSTVLRSKTLAWTLLAAWVLVCTLLWTTRTYVPDEAIFWLEAVRSAGIGASDHIDVSNLLAHPNSYGYGGAWWSLYTALALVSDRLFPFLDGTAGLANPRIDTEELRGALWHYASDSSLVPMYAMRLLALACLVGLGVLLVRFARNSAAASLVVVGLVTLPLAYWSGKVASPELFAAVLVAVAVACQFLLKRPMLAIGFAASGVALKLTVAPIALVLIAFVACDIWMTSKRRMHDLLKGALLAAGLVVVSNLWIVTQPIAGIERLRYLQTVFGPSSDLGEQVRTTLWGSVESWDFTNFGSLLYWSGGVGIILVALAMAFLNAKSLALFLCVALAAQFAFMLTQPIHGGFYWFVAILCLLVPLTMGTTWQSAVAIPVLLLLAYPFTQIRTEIAYRSAALNDSHNSVAEADCINEAIGKYRPTTVYDMAGMGGKATFSDRTIRVEPYHNMSFRLLATDDPSIHQGRSVLLAGKGPVQRFPFLQDTIANYPVLAVCGTTTVVALQKVL